MEHDFLSFLSLLHAIINSSQLLFLVTLLALSLKSALLIYFFRRTFQNEKIPSPIYSLMLALLSSLICDIPWLLTPLHDLANIISYQIYNTFVRISWAFTIIFYQSLGFFLESLIKTQPNTQPTNRQKFSFGMGGVLIIFYLAVAIIGFGCTTPSEKYWFEKPMFIPTSIYCLLSLISSCGVVFSTLRRQHTPRILSKQVKLFTIGIILPLCLFDLVQVLSMLVSPLGYWINKNYVFVNLYTMLFTYAVFYSMRTIIGLRFLNLKDRIQSPTSFQFMDGFKLMLERLNNATTLQELSYITQTFFRETSDIPIGKAHLHIRSPQTQDAKNIPMQPLSPLISFTETFLTTHDESVCKELYRAQILIHDEIAFSNFYEQHPARNSIVQFLYSVNADMFIPIYEKENMIAYIVIERGARANNFYSEMEQNKMLIFANYLGNVINLLKKQNITLLMAQEKALNEELYRKHQEINQYKESIRSFIRSSHQKNIGIVFYKHRLFTYGNQAAKEMVKINLNTQQGHPITRSFKQIAQQVEEYKAAQTCRASDGEGTTLILSGVPNLEGNNTIITVSYPDISDILRQQVDKLHNPSERDYLLYLETTKSGKLISQLIPGTGEQLINFKIELLKTALSKSATLLAMPEQDLPATVELLHHISLREQLHTITLKGPCKNLDVAIKLFGINPIFGVETTEQPLCEQLNDIGTLFIKNIHYLDLETQKHLAELIRYGFFRSIKSDHKENSNVRIICSSDQNLAQMSQDGTFSYELFTQIKETSLTMPSLATLSEEELTSLADGFMEQTLKTSTFKNLLGLSEKDKNKLYTQRPESLHELKKRIEHIIAHKSQQHAVHTETQFSPLYQIHSPELTEVARLGKQALKNKNAMVLLWNTFQNQNQIASFLGVNRSSVNRRCKAYNLGTDAPSEQPS